MINNSTTTLRHRHRTKHVPDSNNSSTNNNVNNNNTKLSNDVVTSLVSSSVSTTSKNNNVATKNEPPLNDNDYNYNNDKNDNVTLVTKISSSTSATATMTATKRHVDSHYYISQWIIIRMTNMIYMIAFLIAIHQNYGLFGHENSLQPVQSILEKVVLKQQQQQQNDNEQQQQLHLIPYWFQWRINGFIQYPMILGWLIPYSNNNLSIVSYVGLLLSTYQFSIGFFSSSKSSSSSWIIQLICWLLYFTIITIASISQTSFYSYGWESQILETGFLTIFLSSTNKASTIIIWLYQWLSFRIAIGAGLIKLRGSSCWTNKTCLYYHFETQPIPSPLSFIFHYLSHYIHRQLVNLDLFVQVYTSWFILFPPIYSRLTQSIIQYIIPTLYLKKIMLWIIYFFLRTGGILQIQLMIGIILSGNFSVLNWLTIIPAIACFDDEFYPILLQRYITPSSIQKQPPKQQHHDNTTHKASIVHSILKLWNRIIPKNLCSIIDIILLILILYLSKPAVDNLLQRNQTKQVMNASYDPFRIVNTYGAFGSVGTERYEVILSVYNHHHRYYNNSNASQQHKKWIEIEFPCKPGNINRRPCFCAPYHYRIDWNIWFIGFPPHAYYLQNREVWLYSLVYKILYDNHKQNSNTISSNSTTTSALYYKQKQQRPWLDLLDSKSSSELNEYFYDQKFNDIENNMYDNNNIPTNVSKKRRYYAPKYAKADIYHYQMANPLWTIIWNYWNATTTTENIIYDQNGYEIGLWWKRKFKQSLIPVVKIDYQLQRLVPAK